MFKETYDLDVEDLQRDWGSYPRITLGFFADHREFWCSFQLPPILTTICTAGWHSSGDVWSTSFHINKLAYKASIGEELKVPLVPMSVVVTSDLLKYRMPKKPQWHPRTFSQKAPQVPVYDKYDAKLIKLDDLDPVQQFVSSRINLRRLRNAALVKVRVRAAYQQKLKTFVVKQKLFLDREELRRRNYLIRLGKYNLRMSRYNEAVERLQRKLSRPLRVGRYGYPQHRYLECNLVAEPGSRHTLGLWWDAENHPDFISWSYARFSDEYTAGGYLDSAGKLAICRNTAEGLGNLLMKEITKRDYGLSRKLFAKISDQKLHIGNLIGEGHQTLNLLSVAYRRLAEFCLAKKGIIKRISHTLTNKKEISNEFLQFKFGAEPLIKDLVGLMEDFATNSSLDSRLVSFKVRTSRVPKPISIDTAEVSFTGTFILSYLAFFRIDDAQLRDLEQFGLIDPAQVFWEITPWSFVVDWVIPVGTWLASLRSTEGLEFRGLTRSLQTTGRYDLKTPAAFDSSGFPNMSNTLGVTGAFYGRLNLREANQALPDNSLILTAKSPYSLSHLLEAIALTVQRLRR